MKKIVVGAVGVVVTVAAVIISSAISTYNNCVAMERGISAQYLSNQNSYDNYFKKVKETAQVPVMYTDSLQKVYTSAISGRYGSKGSQAVFQFIKEHNPNVDTAVFTKLQTVIESGRTSFETDQKTLLDKKRVYETVIGQFPANLYATFLGFPKIDLEKYGIVTSDETQTAFETKKSEYITVNKL